MRLALGSLRSKGSNPEPIKPTHKIVMKPDQKTSVKIPPSPSGAGAAIIQESTK